MKYLYGCAVQCHDVNENLCMGEINLKRRINERKFGSWEELPDGGRRYIYKNQEIYDNNGKLVEIHEKYPDDKGA